MKRVAVLIISGGVLIAATAWLFSHASVQWKALDLWELQTGQYVVEHDTLKRTDEYIPISRDRKWQAMLIEQKGMRALAERKQMQESLAKQNEQNRIFNEAWTAEASGYFMTEPYKCFPYETCKAGIAAKFVVTDTDSYELKVFTGFPDDKQPSVTLGCNEKNRIRFLSYQDLESWKYKVFSGASLEKLRASDKDHPVRMRIEKPAQFKYIASPDKYIDCVTMLSEYEIIE